MTAIHTWIRTLSIVPFILALGLASAQADSHSRAACAEQLDQCLKQCDIDYMQEPVHRAACVPVCSGKFAACDAGVAYERAKPWLEEQARKSKDFFEDLIRKYGQPGQTEDPEGKTKDNSI
ncbi:MAG: hypothetical protein HQ483_01625 [Rhodospirillales bacterium]|nr:hypothetical protein [Rhodospirillales bacterium]